MSGDSSGFFRSSIADRFFGLNRASAIAYMQRDESVCPCEGPKPTDEEVDEASIHPQECRCWICRRDWDGHIDGCPLHFVSEVPDDGPAPNKEGEMNRGLEILGTAIELELERRVQSRLDDAGEQENADNVRAAEIRGAEWMRKAALSVVRQHVAALEHATFSRVLASSEAVCDAERRQAGTLPNGSGHMVPQDVFERITASLHEANEANDAQIQHLKGLLGCYLGEEAGVQVLVSAPVKQIAREANKVGSAILDIARELGLDADQF